MAQKRQILLHEFQSPELRGRFHIAGADRAQERHGQDPARRRPLMGGMGGDFGKDGQWTPDSEFPLHVWRITTQ